ncbi:MAG TPA: hypothetical protein VGN63_16965 [Flavisolibacter sp.]|nr:hypothetical protein [Flavisolibacter sp.]
MSHFISLAEAIDLTSRYRQYRESILKTDYQGQGTLPLSEMIPRAAIDTLLAHPACSGLRIYYGMPEDLKMRAVIVGVDGDGKDILPSSNLSETEEEEDDLIVDRTLRCPDICPDESPLNG